MEDPARSEPHLTTASEGASTEPSSSARDQYAQTLVGVLTNVSDWIAIDSWLGAGKVADPKAVPGNYGESYSAFRAISVVICMSAELAEAAVEMSSRRRFYAVAAVLRQLIECEYLLALFNEDLEQAKRWLESTPEEIRQSFTPAKMRKQLGTFSNAEYWEHCSVGGHPAPKGRRLLEKDDPQRKIWPLAGIEVGTDLGLHLHRIWVSADSVLDQHHVRYAKVRADRHRPIGRANGIGRVSL